MKATTKEVVYINPDLYQGDSTNTPSNSQVVYGNNPNLTTNEFGQTVVNPDIPKPLTPKEQAQQIIQARLKQQQSQAQKSVTGAKISLFLMPNLALGLYRKLK